MLLAVANGPVEVALEDVAHGNRNQVVLPHREVQIGAAHFAHADKRGRNLVVRASHIAGENIGGERGGGRGLDDIAPFQRLRHVITME